MSKLGTYVIKTNEKELFDFVDINLLGLKVVKLDEYPYFIMYFNSDDKCIFQYNFKNNYLYVSHILIWRKLDSTFGYSYDEIKELINIVVKQAYNLKGVKTILDDWLFTMEIEQVYKFNKRK